MRSLLLAVAAMMVATPALADVVGTWKTSRGSKVEVYRCGAAVCGKTLSGPPGTDLAAAQDAKNKDPALRSRSLKGLVIMTGFSGGPASWTGGKIYNPDDGNTYSGTITLAGEGILKLKGCVAAPLCQTQTWTRAN